MRRIDAEALKKAIDKFHQEEKDRLHNPLWSSIDLNALNRLIDNAPTVHDTVNLYPSGTVIIQERPQGKWVYEHDWVHCSFCGHEQNYPSNFCPNCGACLRKGSAE